MTLQIPNNNSAHFVFDLINQAEVFGDHKIDVIITNKKVVIFGSKEKTLP